MTNVFGIPDDVERRIRLRDSRCVYCHCAMKEYRDTRGTPGDKATIEHLRETPPFYWKDGLKEKDIVICCGRCNSSRGKKTLPEWFEAAYCKERNINAHTVADPVRAYLKAGVDNSALQ